MISMLLLFLCAATEKTHATSCPDGLDPYDVLESMYSHSEFVFVGHAIKGPIRRENQHEYSVSSFWKGPVVRSIWLDHVNPDSVREGDRRLIFASQNQYADNKPWYDNLRGSCMPREAFRNVESMLVETVGQPRTPDPTFDTTMQMLLAATIFLGVGGMVVLLGSLIIGRKTL